MVRQKTLGEQLREEEYKSFQDPGRTGPESLGEQLRREEVESFKPKQQPVAEQPVVEQPQVAETQAEQPVAEKTTVEPTKVEEPTTTSQFAEFDELSREEQDARIAREAKKRGVDEQVIRDQIAAGKRKQATTEGLTTRFQGLSPEEQERRIQEEAQIRGVSPEEIRSQLMQGGVLTEKPKEQLFITPQEADQLAQWQELEPDVQEARIKRAAEKRGVTEDEIKGMINKYIEGLKPEDAKEKAAKKGTSMELMAAFGEKLDRTYRENPKLFDNMTSFNDFFDVKNMSPELQAQAKAYFETKQPQTEKDVYNSLVSGTEVSKAMLEKPIYKTAAKRFGKFQINSKKTPEELADNINKGTISTQELQDLRDNERTAGLLDAAETLQRDLKKVKNAEGLAKNLYKVANGEFEGPEKDTFMEDKQKEIETVRETAVSKTTVTMLDEIMNSDEMKASRDRIGELEARRIELNKTIAGVQDDIKKSVRGEATATDIMSIASKKAKPMLEELQTITDQLNVEKNNYSMLQGEAQQKFQAIQQEEQVKLEKEKAEWERYKDMEEMQINRAKLELEYGKLDIDQQKMLWGQEEFKMNRADKIYFFKKGYEQEVSIKQMDFRNSLTTMGISQKFQKEMAQLGYEFDIGKMGVQEAIDLGKMNTEYLQDLQKMGINFENEKDLKAIDQAYTEFNDTANTQQKAFLSELGAQQQVEIMKAKAKLDAQNVKSEIIKGEDGTIKLINPITNKAVATFFQSRDDLRNDIYKNLDNNMTIIDLGEGGGSEYLNSILGIENPVEFWDKVEDNIINKYGTDPLFYQTIDEIGMDTVVDTLVEMKMGPDLGPAKVEAPIEVEMINNGTMSIGDLSANKLDEIAGPLYQSGYFEKYGVGNFEFNKLKADAKSDLSKVIGMREDIIEIAELASKLQTGYKARGGATILDYINSNSEANAKYTSLETRLKAMRADYVKQITGAGVSDNERKTLNAILPAIQDSPTEFFSKLAVYKENYDNILNTKIFAYGFENYDEMQVGVGLKPAPIEENEETNSLWDEFDNSTGSQEISIDF